LVVINLLLLLFVVVVVVVTVAAALGLCLSVGLDGGTTVAPTTMVVDFFPEVCHRVAHHRCVTLRWWASIWQH
jgi:hypothetical protein